MTLLSHLSALFIFALLLLLTGVASCALKKPKEEEKKIEYYRTDTRTLITQVNP